MFFMLLRDDLLLRDGYGQASRFYDKPGIS